MASIQGDVEGGQLGQFHVGVQPVAQLLHVLAVALHPLLQPAQQAVLLRAGAGGPGGEEGGEETPRWTVEDQPAAPPALLAAEQSNWLHCF